MRHAYAWRYGSLLFVDDFLVFCELEGSCDLSLVIRVHLGIRVTALSATAGLSQPRYEGLEDRGLVRVALLVALQAARAQPLALAVLLQSVEHGAVLGAA